MKNLSLSKKTKIINKWIFKVSYFLSRVFWNCMKAINNKHKISKNHKICSKMIYLTRWMNYSLILNIYLMNSKIATHLWKQMLRNNSKKKEKLANSSTLRT